MILFQCKELLFVFVKENYQLQINWYILHVPSMPLCSVQQGIRQIIGLYPWEQILLNEALCLSRICSWAAVYFRRSAPAQLRYGKWLCSRTMLTRDDFLTAIFRTLYMAITCTKCSNIYLWPISIIWEMHCRSSLCSLYDSLVSLHVQSKWRDSSPRSI